VDEDVERRVKITLDLGKHPFDLCETPIRRFKSADERGLREEEVVSGLGLEFPRSGGACQCGDLSIRTASQNSILNFKRSRKISLKD
jgi:hypothetical protein